MYEDQIPIKRIVEALLFVSADPLSLQKMAATLDQPVKVIRDCVEELQKEYQIYRHAFQIEEIAQGFVLRTQKPFAPYIAKLQGIRGSEKLSQAGMEVLAIIAYRQPITRPQIDAIRGVDSSGPLAQLSERGLVEAVGKLEAPGRPTLFGTTSQFLKHFGLKDLKSLPEIV